MVKKNLRLDIFGILSQCEISRQVEGILLLTWLKKEIGTQTAVILLSKKSFGYKNFAN